MNCTTLQGDCRDVLKTLPSESVHCCITSPPYWGLRAVELQTAYGIVSADQEATMSAMRLDGWNVTVFQPFDGFRGWLDGVAECKEKAE